MGFSIIVAVDKKCGIGINNQLPWRLKADMKWFKEITTAGHSDRLNVVIMGRKTWDSIPPKFRPLPNRINIVITHSPDQCQAPHGVSSFEEALQLAYQLGRDVFVIGGSSIYRLAFRHPELENLFITEIDRDFNCDSFFPDYHQLKPVKTLQQGQEESLKYKMMLYHSSSVPSRD